MDTKDVLTAVGLGITFTIAVVNLFYTRRATRKADFIKTVTSERVKWIENLRNNVSKYAGKVQDFVHVRNVNPARADELYSEFVVLGYLIRLQLNPKEELDASIEQILSDIPAHSNLVELYDLLERLVTQTQKLLKKEWDKAKDESELGRLDAPTLTERLARRFPELRGIRILLTSNRLERVSDNIFPTI